MVSKFEQLVSSYIDNNVGIAENILSDDLCIRLRQNIIDLDEDDRMHAAGIGNNARLLRDPLTRKDEIFWLDRKLNNSSEMEFFQIMDDFVAYLNETCYTGISNYEFHYARYDAGAFYKRHIDQFRDDQRRAFSVIFYLNEHWQEGDGGELCVYHPDRTEQISPVNGKCVFFSSSQLEHEVLLSHKSRLSLTGWLRRG